MQSKTIIIAGATGALGRKIAHSLLEKGAKVRALVRKGSTNVTISSLREQGVEIVEVDFSNISELTQACVGGDCLVSAVSGLRDVIVGVQTNLVKAAVHKFFSENINVKMAEKPFHIFTQGLHCPNLIGGYTKK